MKYKLLVLFETLTFQDQNADFPNTWAYIFVDWLWELIISVLSISI